MFGRCCHVALRLRILLLLLTLMLMYSMLWIYKFHTVSYHTVKRTKKEFDVSTLRKTRDRHAPNRYSSKKEQNVVANADEEIIDLSRAQLSNDTDKAVKTTRYTFGNVSETVVKRTKETENKTIRDLKNSTLNGVKYTNLIDNHYADIDRPLSMFSGHKYSKNVSDSKHWTTIANYIPKDMQAKTGAHFTEINEESTFKYNSTERGTITPHQHRENSIIHQERPRPYKSQTLIQMTLRDKPEAILEPLKASGPTFANQNTDKLNSSMITFSNNVNDTVYKSKKTKIQLEEPKTVPYTKNFNMSNLSGKRPLPMLKTSVNETSHEKSLTENTEFSSVSCKVALDVLNQTKIGILIPSSTRNIQNPVLENLTLVNTSLPSLYKTLDAQYVYRIYIGIDEGDYLQTVQNEIKRMFDCVIPVIVHGNNFVKSVNTIANRAYKDGMDYFVRINDDTWFYTENWTSMGISKLKEYCPDNIGVVGPTCNEGNTEILTHDMVHRKHLEIFDFYYPPYLENWWTDDWITKVYEPFKSTKLASWIVKHVTFKSRYIVDNEREQWSKTLIEYDKKRLQKYIGCSCSGAGNLMLSVSVTVTWLICLMFIALDAFY